MLDFPIVDSHVHFWDPSSLSYPWLAEHAALQRPFGPTELAQATTGIEISGFVFVECDCDPAQSAAEVDFVTSLAREEPRIQGIVAAVRVEEADAPARIESLVANPLVRGVRRLLQSEADPEFCLRDEFLRGVHALAAHDLSFDVCVKHHQLDAVIAMARRCPDVRFVLDHIGKPDIRARRFDPWRDQIHDLAGLRNVWCKLSGLVTEADPAAWTEDDLTPYIAHVLDAFGPGRVLFGGDWPVVTLASPYTRWLEALEGPISVLNSAERRAVFADNARRVYRLCAE